MPVSLFELPSTFSILRGLKNFSDYINFCYILNMIIVLFTSPFPYGNNLFNPLHPNTSIHILHTVLFTFLISVTKRIWLTIRSFLNWWSSSCVIFIMYCYQLKKRFIFSSKADGNRLKECIIHAKTLVLFHLFRSHTF